jgi:arylsulfatase A
MKNKDFKPKNTLQMSFKQEFTSRTKKIKRVLPYIAIGGVFQPLASQSTSARPNIVVILADDLGYGDIGAFGATDINTPYIDSLAANGIRFTSFYSSSPVSSPSRFGLLTGRYPRRAGIDHVFFPESFTGIPAQETTIAEKLHDNGYKTGIVGKWHLGHHIQYLPLQNGFDSYFGIPYSNDMLGVAYLNGNSPDSLTVNQHYITQTYTRKAVEFIHENKNQPFFLYLAHNMPHVPLYVSPSFAGKSKRGLYGDVIQEIDWSVGQVLKALKSNGLDKNTLVIFTSDNGPWRQFDIEGGSAGPLRYGKGTTFEGGQRVPGIVYWPEKIKSGSVYDGLALQLDIFPTILSIIGINPSQLTNSLDGENLSPVLLGNGIRQGDEFAYFNQGKIEAFRKGDWKIHFPTKDESILGLQIFKGTDSMLVNLKDDIGEQHNLIDSESAKKREILEALEAFKKRLGDTPPPLVQSMPADNSHIIKLIQRHPEINKTDLRLK